MGKKYDNYVAKLRQADQARAELSAAEGGATLEKIQDEQANLGKAERKADEAWDRFLDDPTG